MAQMNEIERDLQTIASDMRRLEGDYTLYFSGRVPRPPWEARVKFEAALKRVDRLYYDNAQARFRLQQLQARYASLSDLWDRAVRAREEGRPGPFARRPTAGEPSPVEQVVPDRVLHVTSFTNVHDEADKLELLYESMADARRETGEEPVAYHHFAMLVRDQVDEIRRQVTGDVAVRIAVRDGHVVVTARAMKGEPAD